jgi:DNA uptake protein ComE-like DNA-binding protein
LPGVGPVLAKRAVAERQARPFESVEDFGETLGLQRRMIDRLRGLVRVEEPEDEREEGPRRGRVVDY